MFWIGKYLSCRFFLLHQTAGLAGQELGEDIGVIMPKDLKGDPIFIAINVL